MGLFLKTYLTKLSNETCKNWIQWLINYIPQCTGPIFNILKIFLYPGSLCVPMQGQKPDVFGSMLSRSLFRLSRCHQAHSDHRNVLNSRRFRCGLLYNNHNFCFNLNFTFKSYISRELVNSVLWLKLNGILKPVFHAKRSITLQIIVIPNFPYK